MRSSAWPSSLSSPISPAATDRVCSSTRSCGGGRGSSRRRGRARPARNSSCSSPCSWSLPQSARSSSPASGRSAAVSLVPSTVLAVVLVALAAPAGPVPVWWWLIWVTAVLLVLLVGDGRPSAWARLRRVWAERQPVVAVVALLALGAMAVAAFDLGDRADPRDDRSGRLDPIETLNPLAAVVAERNTSPPVELLQIDEPPADRWRLFALERYDGVSWSVDPVFGPIGRQLSTTLEGAEAVDVDMQVLQPPARLAARGRRAALGGPRHLRRSGPFDVPFRLERPAVDRHAARVRRA